MATFKFSRAIDLHWQGYEIVGPAETVFSIPDQLYEEFNDDIAPVEPTLVWLDTNEFLTLSNSVSVTTLTGTIPISVTSTTSGKVVSISSTTNPAGYYLRADGTGATTWAALPSDATGITNIIGTSPISAAVSGTTATISLNANYQTAGSYQPSGTYVTGVVGTSPISATGTTAITVSLNANYQTSGTYVNAVIGTSPASVLTASGTSTVSIVAGSINSTHLSANSVGSSKLIAQAVGTAAISSGAATTGQVLTANGSGGATFGTLASGGLTVSQYSTTVENTIPNHISFALTSVASPYTGFPTAYDGVGNVIYISAGTSTVTAEKDGNVKKFDVATSTIAAATQIAMSANERIIDMAFGSSVLCVLTNSSVSTTAPTARWLILNSSLATLASGNVHSVTQGAENAGESTSNSATYPTVIYDGNANQFVIMAPHCTSTTNSHRRLVYRVIHPSTYTTGYFITPQDLAIGATATSTAMNSDTGIAKFSLPAYHTATSRWIVGTWWSDGTAAPYGNAAQVIFLSQSTTTTAVFSITGRQVITASTLDATYGYTRTPSMVMSSDNTKLYMRTGNGARGFIGMILMSAISASANTNTTTEATATYTSSSAQEYRSSKRSAKALKVASVSGKSYLIYTNGSVNSSGMYGYAQSAVVPESGFLDLDGSDGNRYSSFEKISSSDVTTRIGAEFSPGATSVGTNGGYAYLIMAVHDSANSSLRYLRAARLGADVKTKVTLHSVTDPLEIVDAVTNMTNSDASPSENNYDVYGGNASYTLSGSADFTGSGSVYCPIGSEMYYYSPSSVSTTPTNVNEVTVAKVR